MEMTVEEVLKDEYWLMDKYGVLNTYPTLDRAVAALKLYRKEWKWIKEHKVVIRHHVVCMADHTVDCATLITKDKSVKNHRNSR